MRKNCRTAAARRAGRVIRRHDRSMPSAGRTTPRSRRLSFPIAALNLDARLRARRARPLKLDSALLRDRGLLNGYHLSLHLGQLRCGLLVSADEESCWPEDHDRGRSGDAVFCALAVLGARQSSRPRRDSLRLKGKLLACV